MIKIIIDCYGGDNSPSANVEGALYALAKIQDLHLILTGDKDMIEAELFGKKYDSSRLDIEHAPDVVKDSLKPTDAIRQQKDSSLVRAISMLRTDDSIDGMVSVGSTGVVLVGATLRVGRINGIKRPAFCPILPTMNGGVVGICDSGANVECTPEYLLQFAIMGSLYMKEVYRIKSPRVALLNVGTEETKGDELHLAAYSLLKKEESINFVGNMESRDLLSGNYDLVVCDGFSGNVLIKSTEGACLEMLKMIKQMVTSSAKNKVGALFLKKSLNEKKEFMNYQNYGGSVMLGTRKVIVKGHGSSKAKGITKCIEQAYAMAKRKLPETIEEQISKTVKEDTENV